MSGTGQNFDGYSYLAVSLKKKIHHLIFPFRRLKFCTSFAFWQFDSGIGRCELFSGLEYWLQCLLSLCLDAFHRRPALISHVISTHLSSHTSSLGQHEPLVFCSLFHIYHSFHTNPCLLWLDPNLPDGLCSSSLSLMLSNMIVNQFVEVLNFGIIFISNKHLFLIDHNFSTRLFALSTGFSAMSTIFLNEQTTII